MRSKSAEPMAQLWPARSMISSRWLTRRALATSSGRCSSRASTPRSAVVDYRFDAERAPVLEVLLEAGMLVADVELDIAAGGEDAGAERLPGRLAHLAGKDDGQLLGAADVDVVGHQRLEEAACPARVVEDERARDLDLAHR